MSLKPFINADRYVSTGSDVANQLITTNIINHTKGLM